MNDDGLSLAIGGEGEELSRGGNRGDDLFDLGTSLDLEAVGTVICVALGLEQLVKLGYQLQEIHTTNTNAPEVEGKSRDKGQEKRVKTFLSEALNELQHFRPDFTLFPEPLTAQQARR